MVDTITQYQKIKDEIDLELNKVFESGAYINGPIVKQFRNNLSQFLNGAHVVACANGTDALQVALMAAGVQPGDEVITTPFTFVATVEVVALLGAKPVFVDVDPQTFNIDPEKIEAAITPKTKAIVPVHLFGQCSDMESILSIAQKHGISVIEDAAQSIGAEFTFSDGRVEQSGTMGDMGTTSF
ncbi:MAG: aminotransferase class V-fold PLP-dependent enzyme, partial [Bacteroidetes bacterium]|nr:aminotransferase class V-fold PLP-dependent enzyme [Bacteroidota bacterium]